GPGAKAGGEGCGGAAGAEEHERAIEVIDGIDEAAAEVEGLRDVALEPRPFRGIAPVAVQLEIELGGLLEEVQRLARSRGAGRVVAGAEQELLGALERPALGEVVGQHAAVAG